MSTPAAVRPSDAEALASAARARLSAVRAGLPGDGPAPHGLTAVVVVDDFDPAAFVAGATAFALGLPAGPREGWYRAFTRTVFLAGRPGSVAARHAHTYLAPGGGLAWYGPAPRRELSALSRLLRAFQGPAPVDAPAGPLTVPVPGRPSGHRVDMTVATGGVGSDAYLVHVHHLIAEAVLRGLVRPGDTLRVEHRRALDPADFRAALAPDRAATVQTRIGHGGTGPDLLRLYGVLTSNRDRGGH
ncbi:DUF6182 family protein [Streptomyces sp. NPDC102462]|uniref:DUF6182 family protein n=1 Tax=Streptomyces sp. NPDC102462 TaxID=3366178 RepID=UPI0038133BF6